VAKGGLAQCALRGIEVVDGWGRSAIGEQRLEVAGEVAGQPAPRPNKPCRVRAGRALAGDMHLLRDLVRTTAALKSFAAENDDTRQRVHESMAAEPETFSVACRPTKPPRAGGRR
jgi:hypothetical protein